MRKNIRVLLLGVLFSSHLLLHAQSKTVSGKVTDASDGTELLGVNILIKGTLNGAVTDFDGKYSLNVSSDDTLVFKYIGYENIEIVVGNRTVIDAALPPDIGELSEVVIIGYGQVEQGDVTGVVNKIDSKTFNKGMLTTPEQLLAGKVAGVQITQNSGEPGGGITVRMRGGTSITASNDPLYVVDGIPLDGGGVAGTRNSLNFINPADIADMTVLKDASAAAIYGSRGANGVVIITTKTGRQGKPQISYDGSVSISNIIDRVDMLNTEEFVFTLERKGPRNLTRLGIFDPEIGDNVYSDTDWIDEILETAVGQNHNIGVGFGTKSNLVGRVSFNYQNLDGILNTSNTERMTGSINLTQKLFNDDLVINWNSKHSLTNNRFAPNVIASALLYAPTQPIFRNDTTYFQWNTNLAPRNPVEEIASTTNIGEVKRNLFTVSLSYNLPFIDGLTIKGNYAQDRAQGLSQVTNEIEDLFAQRGGFSYFNDERTSTLFESYLNYITNTSIGKLDLLAGYSYQEFDLQVHNNLNLSDTVALPDLSISNPTSFIDNSKLDAIRPFLQEVPSFPTENRLISFWGRANLDIKDRYLITATVRSDGSTRFGTNNRWGVFPAFAVGWRLIDEPFMDGAKDVFQNLKVRMSYGITGNQDFDNYLYVETYNEGGDRAQYILGQDTVNTYRPQGVDPQIKWEETESINFGVDYGLLNGRLTGSIDLYQKTTNDLLFTIAFPIGTLTRDRAITNIGEIENKGIEFLINSVVVDKPDFWFDLSFNAAYNKNKILALDNSNLPSFQGYITGNISGDIGQTIQVLRVGQSVNSFFVYQHKRDNNGNPLSDGVDHNGDGSINNLDMYEDLNEDELINEDDLRPYKKPAPNWILGMTANAAYKNWDFAATFRAQLGNYVYNNISSVLGAFQGVNNNFSPNNVHMSAYDNDLTNRQLLSDIYIEDASFLKLDNITVGYGFNVIDKIKSRAYVTASNLLNISGYSGIDPEAGGFNGIDDNLYPRSRTFVAGINLTIN